MKLAIALSTCLLLVPTLSFADPAQGALAAGKPAGIRQAQEIDNTTLVYHRRSLAVLGIVIGVAASGGQRFRTSNTCSADADPTPDASLRPPDKHGVR